LKVSKPILVALIVSVLFSVYLIYFTGKKKILSPGPQMATALKSNMQSVQKLEGQHVGMPVRLVKTDFAWRRDPFFIVQKMEENITGPKVQLKLLAILEGRKGRIAIINNEILKTGDIIGDERVMEIGQNSVVLIKKGTKRIIPIEEAFSGDLTKNHGKEGEK
jgi:hypothetical protein